MKIRTTKTHYIADCRPHGREKRFPKTPDGKRAARALLKNVNKQYLTRGEYADPTLTPLFKDLVVKYIEHEMGRAKRKELVERSVIEKQIKLESIGEYVIDKKQINDMRVGEIRVGHIKNEIINELYKERAWTTGKKWFGALHGFFKWAYECEIIPSNPTFVKKPKKPIKQSQPMDRISKDDIKKIIENGKSNRANVTDYRLRIKFATETGLRMGEQLALTWDDIDLTTGHVTVNKSLKQDRSVGPPKTLAGYRTVNLNPQLVDDLRLWKLSQPLAQRSKNLVFPSTVGTHGYNNNWREKILHKACDRAGVPRIRWHDLRHYYASILLFNAREEIGVVSRLMGHANISTTIDIYGHWLDDSRRDKEISERHAKAFA